MLDGLGNTRGGRTRIALGVFIPVAVFCLAWVVSARPIQDYDFWWHLATGRYMAETGALLQQDPFSYITPHIDGINDEARTLMTLRGYWLAQLLLYYIYSSFSFSGIIVYKGLVYASTVLLMYMLMRRSGMRAATSAFVLLPFFFPKLLVYLSAWNGERPGHLSFPLALLMVYLLEGIREAALKGKRPQMAYLIAPALVMALWANVHGGYILGIILVCIYMAEIILLPLLRRIKPDRDRMLALYAGLAAIAASYMNPNGYKAFEVVLDIARAGPPVGILEELSPLKIWQLGISRAFLLYIVAAICLGLPVIRRMGISQSLVVAFLVTISFAAMRHVQELVFICYPLIMAAWAGLIRERAGRFLPPMKAVAAAFVIMALTAGYTGAERYLGTDANISGHYPVESVNFIARVRPEGNLFNYYDWGGYLIWTLYPRYKVFIDGRLLSYKASGAYADIEGSPDPATWERLTDAYGINTAILPAYSIVRRPVTLFRMVLNSREWIPVHTDRSSVVFLKKTPANEWIIESMGIDKREIVKWVDMQRPGRRQ